MNYISGIISFLFGVGALVVGLVGLQQYFGGAEKELARLEKLKKEGHNTIAWLDTMVLELKIKGVKTYSLAYKFEVEGKPYKGSYHFNDYDALDSLTGIVTYLPSDPTISSLDINTKLAKAKKNVAEYESSSLGLWLGIGLLLFGLFQLFRAYRKFTAKPSPKPSPPPIPPQGAKYPPDSDFV